MRVVGDCQAQLQTISQVSGPEVSLNALESINDAFKRITPYSDAPLIIAYPNTHANWFQWFLFYRNRSRDSINRVLAQSPYVDAELVSLLTAIDDCSHFWQVDILQSTRFKNEDLSAWASTFVSYCKLCKKLNDYRESICPVSR